jgi:hypothetical protein
LPLVTTESKSPLAGLDAVDWGALEHAYGDAADVPGQLRALCSADEAERHKARHDLYGNIFHQGSRYQATAVAVPFLARMAVDASTPERDATLEMLAALAVGYDESYLPDGVDVARWRDEVAEFRARDPEEIRAELDEWVAAATEDGERRVRSMRRAMFDYDQQLRAVTAELDAYDAVRRELPSLAGLLEDGDAAVRTAAAYLLAWFPEESVRLLPPLLRLVERETDLAVLATALVAAGLLGDGTLVDLLRGFLVAEQQPVRWAAATALVRLGAVGDGGAAVAELTAAQVVLPEAGSAGIPFHEGDLRGYAAASLAGLGDGHRAEALAAVTDGLATATGTAVFALADAALSLAFRQPQPAEDLPDLGDMDEGQRRLIHVLASLDEDTWQWVNFLQILRAWGLPQSRSAMRDLAGPPPG